MYRKRCCDLHPFKMCQVFIEEVHVHLNRSYLVCATPRSGSTLLCEALTNTGIAGNPKEYFEALRATGLPRQPQEYFITLENPEVSLLLGDFSRLQHTASVAVLQKSPSYVDYLATVFEEGTTPNGVFGAKIMWGYFADFIHNLRDIPGSDDVPVPDLLTKIFPNLRYIWVTRRDKVRQAISLWKAIQTWTWREDELPSQNGHSQPHQHELNFHFEAIDHLVQQIIADEQAWQHYFAEAGIQPFRVIYEDFAPTYQETAQQILEYLDIPIPGQLTFAERRMKQQTNALSENWIDYYHYLKHQQSL